MEISGDREELLISARGEDASKTWLRNTMTQKRLTHFALLHVHQRIVHEINLSNLMTIFINKNPERRSTFDTH